MALSAKSGASKDTIWSREFLFIFIANTLCQMGLNMSYGILPAAAEELGGTSSEIGIVASAFAIAALGAKFVAGPAIDSYNRKKVMIGGVIFMTLAFAGYGFSPDCTALTVANFVRGLAMAFATTASLVIATDFLPENKIGEGVGIFSLSQVVCSAAGPALAFNIAVFVGYQVTFFVSAAVELLTVLFVVLIPRESHGTKDFKIALDRVFAKEVLPVTILAFLMASAYASLQAFVAIFGLSEGIPQEQVGLFFTIYAVSLFFIRPACGKVADRIGYRKVIVPGGVAFCLAFVILANASNIWVFALASLASAFGYGMCQPLFQALAMKLAGPEQRGAASCTYYFGVDGGFVVGPNLAGALVTAFGYHMMWYFMVIPIGVAVVAALFLPMDEKSSRSK